MWGPFQCAHPGRRRAFRCAGYDVSPEHQLVPGAAMAAMQLAERTSWDNPQPQTCCTVLWWRRTSTFPWSWVAVSAKRKASVLGGGVLHWRIEWPSFRPLRSPTTSRCLLRRGLRCTLPFRIKNSYLDPPVQPSATAALDTVSCGESLPPQVHPMAHRRCSAGSRVNTNQLSL